MSEPVRHTPMRAIWDGGSVVGYRCDHCAGVWTLNMQPSEDQRYIFTNPGFQGRFVPNKSHKRRTKAARKMEKLNV